MGNSTLMQDASFAKLLHDKCTRKFVIEIDRIEQFLILKVVAIASIQWTGLNGDWWDRRRMTLGSMLKRLRANSDITQLELALSLGISQRHVSFIESGKSKPTLGLLKKWLEELQATISISNAIYLEAGYPPLPVPDTAPLLSGLGRTIELHNPYPAFVFDSNWRMLDANAACGWLCELIMPDYMAALVSDSLVGFDMIDCLASDCGLLSKLVDPRHAAVAWLNQLRAEEWVTPTLQPRIEKLEKRIVSMVGPLKPLMEQLSAFHLIHKFDTSLGRLEFLTMQTLPGLPQDISTVFPRGEFWYPADDHTRSVMQRHIVM